MHDDKALLQKIEAHLITHRQHNYLVLMHNEFRSNSTVTKLGLEEFNRQS